MPMSPEFARMPIRLLTKRIAPVLILVVHPRPKGRYPPDRKLTAAGMNATPTVCGGFTVAKKLRFFQRLQCEKPHFSLGCPQAWGAVCLKGDASVHLGGHAQPV